MLATVQYLWLPFLCLFFTLPNALRDVLNLWHVAAHRKSVYTVHIENCRGHDATPFVLSPTCRASRTRASFPATPACDHTGDESTLSVLIYTLGRPSDSRRLHGLIKTVHININYLYNKSDHTNIYDLGVFILDILK